MAINATFASQRKAYFRMIRPDMYRVMLAYNLEDLDGRWYHHYHVRGNTLICVPGGVNREHAPLGVTTWQVSEIIQALQQALAEFIIDDATFETIDHTLTCMFDGCYVDTDYMCPSIKEPSQYHQLRTLFNELSEPALWSWDAWLALETHMNNENIAHGYYHEDTDADDEDFMRVIDETVTFVDLGLADVNGFDIDVIDIDDVIQFDYETGYASDISL
jgi:hypothetical protein